MPAKQCPTIGRGLYIGALVTSIPVEPLLRRGDGLCYSDTSFVRQDSGELRHAGLLILRRWPKGFKPGKYFAVILGASQKARRLRLTYHLLVLHKKADHFDRAFILEVNDTTLEQKIPQKE